ncbi:hypothetical protein DFJ73DRAFT_904201 [Zopfochytrium polystomum]|nr:hypothetical protein DFJ73DRAFT_904201 [Zopfochytrium polystomum]
MLRVASPREERGHVLCGLRRVVWRAVLVVDNLVVHRAGHGDGATGEQHLKWRPPRIGNRREGPSSEKRARAMHDKSGGRAPPFATRADSSLGYGTGIRRSPSLRAAPTTVPIRPRADESEQDNFVDLFFRRRVTVVQVVHKLSNQRDKYKAFLPKLFPFALECPFLTTDGVFTQTIHHLIDRAAICAMGASDEAVKNLLQDVMMCYYEFARSHAMQWLDAPSLESLQALLILADVSLR